jgi:SnoaL-like protein
MTDTHARFREAALARDLEAVRALLRDDVVFRSPVVHRPYEGADAVLFLLGHVMATFEDFRYVDELAGPGSAALVFEARVGDRALQGLDLLRLDADGRIAELTVMVRPLSGLTALAEAMGARIQAAADA